MYLPLGIKTDYSLLQSLIKIKDIFPVVKKHNITAIGILDDNLCGSMEFYDECIKNNIKPIIGLSVIIDNSKLYLYAINYNGYKELLKINTKVVENNLKYDDLQNKDNIKIALPFESYSKYKLYLNINKNTYLAYKNYTEKRNALEITKNIVFINEVVSLENKNEKYLEILYKIGEKEYNKNEYYYLLDDLDDDDIKTTINFSYDINIEIDKSKRYIPIFKEEISSVKYLKELTLLGLNKRFDNKPNKEYIDRLNYELDVIIKMGFVDYFLIVYDYVKFAKSNNIYVGPGRGSAAGSLVSYVLGITNIDPIKYDLLFERFLNQSRVTMPDIDIDFEDVKRNDVVEYVRNRYGKKNVAPIMTYGTLASRQVLRDVSKAIDGDSNLIEQLIKNIDQKLSLEENKNNKEVIKLLQSSKELSEIYQIALKLEGLKKHISTHAAGVVISSVELDEVIPIIYNGENINTGLTMNYLEELGLLKMDFLALSNLTTIHNILDLIDKDLDINKIDLNDEKVFDLFKRVDTDGIFQFESPGMKNFIKKLQPSTFKDLYAALALFRPGPMDNIDLFIRRKEGKEKIDYIDKSLEPILKDTYGIIVYQEQIMQILTTMAKYSFQEADIIRRAMSKKKQDVILNEKERFVEQSVKNGYTKDTAEKVYSLILKFADYGFNKAHSVAYAIIGYQMAYLKVYYPEIFIANLLNMSIGSEIKTKDYLDEAKKNNIYILKPDINLSEKNYKIGTKKLRLPLSVVKNVGIQSTKDILEERETNGKYNDFFNFVARTYKKGINRKILESLISADCFSSFKVNHQTLINNIDNAIRYAEIIHDLDESLVETPILEEFDEYDDTYLMQEEIDSYGFYISNHPASKYTSKDIVKLSQIKANFNKNIKSVVIINSMRKIKTKKNEEMYFINGQDETGSCEFVCFPNNVKLLKDIKKNDLVLIYGLVARRLDKYQININNISKV